jgi:hypothetical protein
MKPNAPSPAPIATTAQPDVHPPPPPAVTGLAVLWLFTVVCADPNDRIDELGDASVPFTFDVHAMIYSQDAPGLEKALHDALSTRRVNLVNLRKEFFHVTLDEIEPIVRAKHGEFQLTRLAEAAGYRQSLAIRQARINATRDQASPALISVS